MGWSKHTPHGLTFAQAAQAQRDHERKPKHDETCDCDRCCMAVADAAARRKAVR